MDWNIVNHGIVIFGRFGGRRRLFRQLIPDKKIKDISQLDIQRLWQKGIRGILFDIDNTLESHRIPEPSPKISVFLQNVQEAGFKICLISNGKQERVQQFNRNLKLPAIAKAGKPLKKSFRAAMRLMGTKPSETAFVGDQIFTDVFGGNRTGMTTILVEPIEPIENAFFYVKRFFKRFVMKQIKE